MNPEHKALVSVIGAAVCTTAQEAAAQEVGKLLAESGVILVCGGRSGVMEAACRGAFQAGGWTIGLLPGTDHEAGNPYLSIAIPTGLGHARNVLVAQAGQAVFASGGEYGTLSEIAIALKMGKKVVGLHTWKAENHGGRLAEVHAVESPEAAVSIVNTFLSQSGEGG